MKLGLFGGTFNPVHIGHVRLARICAAQAALDKLLVIPTATPPHKAAGDMPDDGHRLAMLDIAFAGSPPAEICPMELARGGKSYTADTLDALRLRCPNDAFFLIVGSDMYFTLESWARADMLREAVTVLTMAREQNETERLREEQCRLAARGWRTVVYEEPPFVASSTAVRAGDFDLTPLAVADYIAQNGLYGADADAYPWDFAGYEAMMRGVLSEDRAVHSMLVAERAVHLARLHGASVPLCRAAGILHDLCKEMPPDRQLQYLRNSDRISDKLFLACRPVWHGFAAAELIREELGLVNRELLDAVRYHTTARAAMSRTEQVVYLADLTSADRDYSEADTLRSLSDASLSDGMVFACRYFKKTLKVVCRETQSAFDSYLGGDGDFTEGDTR